MLNQKVTIHKTTTSAILKERAFFAFSKPGADTRNSMVDSTSGQEAPERRAVSFET